MISQRYISDLARKNKITGRVLEELTYFEAFESQFNYNSYKTYHIEVQSNIIQKHLIKSHLYKNSLLITQS